MSNLARNDQLQKIFDEIVKLKETVADAEAKGKINIEIQKIMEGLKGKGVSDEDKKKLLAEKISEIPQDISDKGLKTQWESDISQFLGSLKSDDSLGASLSQAIEFLGDIRKKIPSGDGGDVLRKKMDQIVLEISRLVSNADQVQALEVGLESLGKIVAPLKKETQNKKVVENLEKITSAIQGKKISFRSKGPEKRRARADSGILSEEEESLALKMLLRLSQDMIIDMIVSEFDETSGSLLGLCKLIKSILDKTPLRKEFMQELVRKLVEMGVSENSCDFLLTKKDWAKDLKARKINSLIASEPEYICYIGLDENFYPLVEELVREEEIEDLGQILGRFSGIFSSKHMGVKFYVLAFLPKLIDFLRTHDHHNLIDDMVTSLIDAIAKESSKDVLHEYFAFVTGYLDRVIVSEDMKKLQSFFMQLDSTVRENSKAADYLAQLHQVIIKHPYFEEVIKIVMKGSMDPMYFAAFDICSASGDQTVPVLLRQFESYSLTEGSDYDQFQMYFNVSEVIKSIDSEKTYKVIKEKLFDDRWFVVCNIVRLMGIIKKNDFVQSLMYPLNHDDARVRMEVVQALGEIGTPDALAALATIFTDSDPKVKRTALSSLLKIGSSAVIPIIQIALKDFDVSEEAKRALASLESKGIS